MPHRRTYESDAIRVHWNSARCIHVGFCLRALPQVFDTGRRPWVDIHGADTDAIVDAVERCPTGALLYERLDDQPPPEPPRPTQILPIDDGPLLITGDLDVRGPDGEQITHEQRLTLCRCGLSRNQPFCDNSHLRRGWKSDATHEPEADLPPPRDNAAEEPTKVIAKHDASLDIRGHLHIYHSDGRPNVEAGRAVLCRCGNSSNQPFCDGSHERVEFKSRKAEVPRDRLEAETPAAFTPNDRVPDPRELSGD